eukprot:m.13351 g.13351  ORF g.13351 m.13351 type:complete len:636 (+) comp5936_c0_seq1:181-2088(+)
MSATPMTSPTLSLSPRDGGGWGSPKPYKHGVPQPQLVSPAVPKSFSTSQTQRVSQVYSPMSSSRPQQQTQRAASLRKTTRKCSANASNGIESPEAVDSSLSGPREFVSVHFETPNRPAKSDRITKNAKGGGSAKATGVKANGAQATKELGAQSPLAKRVSRQPSGSQPNAKPVFKAWRSPVRSSTSTFMRRHGSHSFTSTSTPSSSTETSVVPRRRAMEGKFHAKAGKLATRRKPPRALTVEQYRAMILKRGAAGSQIYQLAAHTPLKKSVAPVSRGTKEVEVSIPTPSAVAKPVKVEREDLIVIDDSDDEGAVSIGAPGSSTTQTTSPQLPLGMPAPGNDLYSVIGDYLSKVNVSPSQMHRVSAKDLEAHGLSDFLARHGQDLDSKIEDLIEKESARSPETLVDLQPDDRDLAQRLWAMQPHEVVAQLSGRDGFEIKGSDFSLLMPGEWLSDAIVCGYFSLICRRANELEPLTACCINSHLLGVFREEGYAKIRRWTRKRRVLEHKMLLVPVHVSGNHWCCGCVNFQHKTITYYDSMNCGSPNFHSTIRAWLKEESLDKMDKPFDFTGWQDCTDTSCPQQRNGIDCGVFACQFARCLAEQQPFWFSQKHMQDFRVRMATELYRKQLFPFSDNTT